MSTTIRRARRRRILLFEQLKELAVDLLDDACNPALIARSVVARRSTDERGAVRQPTRLDELDRIAQQPGKSAQTSSRLT